jgi:hypothetical protein
MAAGPSRQSAVLVALAPVLVALLALAGCRTTKILTGRVLDYDTRQPIASAAVRAAQSGWGWSNGLVWDKSYESTATSDPTGHFSIRYNVGDSANLVVAADGYSEWRHFYAAGDNAEVRLRRRPVNPLHSSVLTVGVNNDGSRFGWSFSAGKTTADQLTADLFPEAIAGDGKSIRLLAGGRGGIRFWSRRDLGVEDDVLIFAPPAPPDDYTPAVTLNFGDDSAATEGVYFVRTGDGEHFAKFEVGPSRMTGSGLGVRQSFLFVYVYDPAGGRDLPFEHAPLVPVR